MTVAFYRLASAASGDHSITSSICRAQNTRLRCASPAGETIPAVCSRSIRPGRRGERDVEALGENGFSRNSSSTVFGTFRISPSPVASATGASDRRWSESVLRRLRLRGRPRAGSRPAVRAIRRVRSCPAGVRSTPIVSPRTGAQIQQRRLQHAPLDEKERDQQSADPAVAVAEGCSR